LTPAMKQWKKSASTEILNANSILRKKTTNLDSLGARFGRITTLHRKQPRSQQALLRRKQPLPIHICSGINISEERAFWVGDSAKANEHLNYC
jgi:hypothetical protein